MPDGGEGRRPAGGVELVQGVERHDLQAASRIQGGGVDPSVNPLDRLDVARIAVVDRVRDEAPGSVEEADVDTPCVDADAEQVWRRTGRVSEPRHDLVVQAEDVPVEPILELDRLVREAVDLLEDEPPIGHPPDYDTAARGAEVDRRDGAIYSAHRRIIPH
jgi:hypothetical protein